MINENEEVKQELINSIIEWNLALVELQKAVNQVLKSSQEASKAVAQIYEKNRNHQNINN